MRAPTWPGAAGRPSGWRQRAINGVPSNPNYNPGVRRPWTIEVLDVRLGNPDREHLRGFNIDAPQAGTRSDGNQITVVGWAVGKKSRVAAVEVMSGDEVAARAPVEIERAGVARAYAEAPGSKAAGFRLTLAAEGKGEDELVLMSVLEDGTRIPLGAVRVKLWRRGLLPSRRRSRAE